MRCSKNSSKREIYSDTGLPQETRKIRNKPNITSKVICKRINKAQSHQKKKKKQIQRENEQQRNKKII